MPTNNIGRYRWTICSLIFFATTINYLDRSVISLLKSTLEKEFHWTETDYSNIVIAFQVCYAFGMLVVGRVIDKLGTKIGYAVAIAGWSIAAAAHGLVRSTIGFVMARGALGVTEAGNFPAAIKTTAEWFPKKERAYATGLFNSGANVGAILAPLSVPFIEQAWGWEWAFILTGVTGVIWLFFWIRMYEIPARHKKLGKAEYDYIHSDNKPAAKSEEAEIKQTPWGKLLQYRQTWAFILGKFLTDPVWWFYLFWLPAFLEAQYGIKRIDMALPVALVYTMSTFGSIGGGWLPLRFVNSGWEVFRSRKTAMFIYAIGALPVIFAQLLGGINMWLAVVIIGIAAAAHQAWSANIFTTVSDMFPKKAVASVTGLGGMAGALGGMLIAFAAGHLFDHYKALGHIETGYYIMFFICGFAYLTAWVVMHFLVPREKEVEI